MYLYVVYFKSKKELNYNRFVDPNIDRFVDLNILSAARSYIQIEHYESIEFRSFSLT